VVKRSFGIALLVLILGLSGLILFGACSAPSQNPGDKAAIVDQLYTLQPNPFFIREVTRELEGFGFKVDVYQGDVVTVDLFRNLPGYGYKLIIFRVHSGLLGVDPRVTGRTWLFTAEPYSKTRHVIEQLTGQVTYAKTDDDAPWFFAISSKFIAESMKGKFDNTAIVMMGCDCLHFEDLAQAFIGKGASAYMAWDASVHLDYVDNATPTLIEKLCSEGHTIAGAVAKTMGELGPDPDYGAVLMYYPQQSGEKTLRQVIE
jgi:hypothetical protein